MLSGQLSNDLGIALYKLIDMAKASTANENLVSQVANLLNAGANPQICDNNQISTLHIARFVQNAEQRQAIIKLLLIYGADPNKRTNPDGSWSTPVGLAGAALDWNTVITFATAPSKIAPTAITLGAALWDALHAESTEESRKAANSLLDAGADVNQEFYVGGVGKRTFHGKSACSDEEIIHKLLQRGVKINCKDSTGKTAIQRLTEENKINNVVLFGNAFNDHKEFLKARLNCIVFQRAKQFTPRLPVTIMTHIQGFLFPLFFMKRDNLDIKTVYEICYPKIQLVVTSKEEEKKTHEQHAQQENIKIVLFKKIYAALREGQKSGIMPKTCYQWDNKNLDPVMLAEEITEYANDYKKSRTAIAWQLAEEFKESNADGNLTLPLFEKIYEISFRKSSYFSKSNLLSTSHCFGFTYFSSTLKKQIQDKQITQEKVDAMIAKNPNSRTACIYRAFR